MQCVTLPRITELNPHLLCVLCGGYYIDATAIIECLHAFCKSCIVRYLETHRYCPICDVLVHKTEPLQNIRPDKIRQSIVYKLVPDLYKKEMCNRRNFYLHVHPQLRPHSKELKGEISEESNFFSSDDTVNLSLEYMNSLRDDNYFFMASSGKRYFKCQTTVSIKNLRKLITAKYELGLTHEIRFFFEGSQLPEHFKLLDIAYISSWKRIGYIRLLYEILIVNLIKQESILYPISRPVNDSTKCDQLAESSNPQNINNVICVAKIPTPNTKPVSLLKSNLDNSSTSLAEELKPVLNTVKTAVSNEDKISIIASLDINVGSTTSLGTSQTCTTVNSTGSSVLCEHLSEIKTTNTTELIISIPNSEDNFIDINNAEIAANLNAIDESTFDKSSENKFNDKSELNLKSKRVHELTSSTKTVSEKSESNSAKLKDACPVPTKVPKISNGIDLHTSNFVKKDGLLKTCISFPKLISTTNITSVTTSCNPILSTRSPVYGHSNAVKNNLNSTLSDVRQRNEMKLQRDNPRPIFNRNESSPMIRTTTKTSKLMARPWTSSVCSPTSMPKSTAEIDEKRESTKIIKSRNIPRFLGNPSSGIRPMYQVGQNISTPDKVLKNEDSKKFTRNVSVLKVDPKTLSPILTSSSTETSDISSISQKPFCYTSSPKPFPSHNMYTPRSAALHFPPSVLPTKLPPHMYPYILEHGSLQQMSQLVERIRMYASFNTESEDMTENLDLLKAKASTSNIYNPPMYNTSLPLSFFNPAIKQTKHEKNQDKLSTKQFPPTIQRIPPSNNNNKTSSGNERSNERKCSTDIKHDAMNGQIKSKSKKDSEMSNFSINNLIPLNDVKHASHNCSADGVDQICDQLLPMDRNNTTGKNNIDKNTKVIGKSNFQVNNS